MQSGTFLLFQALKALSDPVRMRILRALPASEEDDQAWNVSQLAQFLEVPQPTVSHHLGVLRNAGLVEFRKSSRDVYYWMNREVFETTLRGLEEQFDRSRPVDGVERSTLEEEKT